MTMRERVCLASAFALGVVSAYAAAIVVANAKPQPATVPREVPEPEPRSAKLPEPWPGFDATPIDDIRQRLRALTLPTREAVRAYEEATLKRRGILNVLAALEQERANGR